MAAIIMIMVGCGIAYDNKGHLFVTGNFGNNYSGISTAIFDTIQLTTRKNAKVFLWR